MISQVAQKQNPENCKIFFLGRDCLLESLPLNNKGEDFKTKDMSLPIQFILLSAMETTHLLQSKPRYYEGNQSPKIMKMNFLCSVFHL